MTKRRADVEVETLWLLFQEAVEEAEVPWKRIHETFRTPADLEHFVGQLFEAEAAGESGGLPSKALLPAGFDLDLKLALLRRGTGVAPPKVVVAKDQQQQQQSAPATPRCDGDRRAAATTERRLQDEEAAYRQRAWTSYCWSQCAQSGWQSSQWSGIPSYAAAANQQQHQWQAAAAAAAAAQLQSWGYFERRRR